MADGGGLARLAIELKRTLMDDCGRQPRGLQNRLQSSIDIRPRSHSSANVRRVRRVTANDSQLSSRTHPYRLNTVGWSADMGLGPPAVF
jgi:hypothetical protein